MNGLTDCVVQSFRLMVHSDFRSIAQHFCVFILFCSQVSYSLEEAKPLHHNARRNAKRVTSPSRAEDRLDFT